MKGKVTIYKGYEPILEESNLVVDGFKEQIVDMMTRIPAPSATYSGVSSTYDVSNFGIHGITIGPARSAFPRIHSLAALSGSVYDSQGAMATVTSSFDPSDGTSWKYNSDITNHYFSSVNTPVSPSYPNNSLVNPVFSSINSKTQNNKFTAYSLNTELSGFFMNDIMNLYELSPWRTQSFLRYFPTQAEYDDTYYAGSCARHDFDTVSAIYSSLSGTSPSSTYAEPKDGILYVRSFSPSSSPESSGCVALSQMFTVAGTTLEPLGTIASASVVAEITGQFSSVSGTGASANINVTVRDVTRGQTYNFSAGGSTPRHSWGGSGSPLVIPAVAGTSGTFSKFINIPNNRRNNHFELTFHFFCAGTSNPLGVYFWNAGVNVLEGWTHGNVFSGSDIQRVINNDYANPSLYLYCSGTNVSPSGQALSSSTYISQGARIDPLKKYCFNLRPSNVDLETTDYIRQAVVKWSSGNVRELGRYDLLTDSSSTSLKESRLGDKHVVSPELNRRIYSNWFNNVEVKPSDLCLEVTPSAMLSGVVEMDNTRPAILRADILKKFQNGVSGTNASIRIRTYSFDSGGNYRYFNFTNGDWDLSSSYTVFNSSSLVATGDYVNFVSNQIDVTMFPVLGVPNYKVVVLIDGGETVKSSVYKPAHIKNIRLDSLVPASDVFEVFNFKQISEPSEKWVKSDYGRENILSGQPNDVLPKLYPFPADANTAPTQNVQSMFAASASTHTSEGEYEVFIFNNEIIDSGEFVKIDCATLTDSALIATTEDITGDKFTSEGYYPAPQFDIVNQPVVRFYDKSALYGPIDSCAPGTAPIFASAGWWPSGLQGLSIGATMTPGGGLYSPLVKPSYTFNLSDITLPTSSTQLAFSFEYNKLQDGEANPRVKWQAAATITCGVCHCCLAGKECREVVWWDNSTSTWAATQLSGNFVNDYKTSVERGSSHDVKTVFTPKVNITNDKFDKSSKITFYILTYGWNGADYFLFTNWKFYTITTPPPRDLPEFPNAYDREVQTPMVPTAELGHFTNQIQYMSSLSGINKDRALGNANWVPRAGTSALTVSGVDYAGSANEYSVINSDGFILFGYNGPVQAGAANGFYVSATSNTISYVIDVVSADYGFLDVQGGIESIGLWTLDTKATYKKLKANGFELSAGVYDKSEPWTNGLYTLDDETRNPVFRLASKKVFREPLELDVTPPYPPRFRIIWEVTFY